MITPLARFGILSLALSLTATLAPADPILLTPQSAATQHIQLTPTVGVDIIKITKNPDGTITCLFQWKDKDGNLLQRAVTVNKDTVIGVNGKLIPFEQLDESLLRNKVVATVGPDMVTAISLRFGKEMMQITRDQLTDKQAAALLAAAPAATPASNEALDKRVADIIASLHLNAKEREARLTAVLTADFRAVRDAHNAGFAPEKSLHEKFLAGLAADLTPDQVAQVEDKITIDKVRITFNAYHDIVADLTAADDAFILAHLRQAREDSLDVKNIDEVSAIFDKYKKDIENYLDAHGHDWKAAYKTFTDAQKAAKTPPATPPASQPGN